MKKKIVLFLCFMIFIAGAGCNNKKKTPDMQTQAGEPANTETGGEEEPAETGNETPPAVDTSVKRDPLEGGPYPSLLITQSRFLPAGDGSGKNTKPGPARLIILRKTGKGWEQVIVDDADSNVCHKAMQIEGAVLTAGAMGAFLKLWTFKDGKWADEVLWNPKFGGKIDRLRDFEIGKVMPGPGPQVAIATHDQGVVAVAARNGKEWSVTQIDRQADTFVHEIELGDLDGDGLDEIYATPSQPNKVGVSQSGEVVRFRWDGKKFEKSPVKKWETRHVKEILVTKLAGESRPTLFAVLEAELEKIAGKSRIKTPVEIIKFSPDESGQLAGKTVASINDAQCRFLVAGDVDGNGKTELVAAAMKTGLWLIRPGDGETWKTESIDKDSSGYEHSMFLADMTGNGKPELYVAADDQHALNAYTWNGSGFDKSQIIPLEGSIITWNITQAKL
ncbi:MAG: VCBS repeat-containing protein [Pseudomonadota bacterium]